MSHRTPAKLPSIPKNAASVFPCHQTLPEHGRLENPDDAGLKTVLRQITHALTNLDFNQFVKISPIHTVTHTPVYSPVWKPDPDQFRRIALNASTFVRDDANDEEVGAAMEAKANLNEQLVYLDALFKYSEENGRPVGNVRSALAWLAERNNETYRELYAKPMSHPLDRNTTTPKRVRRAVQAYSTTSPTVPNAEKFPEDIHTRFSAASSHYKHDPPQTPHSNRSAMHSHAVHSPNGYGGHGNSTAISHHPVHSTPGRTQVHVKNVVNSGVSSIGYSGAPPDQVPPAPMHRHRSAVFSIVPPYYSIVSPETVSPPSCLKPTDENTPFIPPHPSYYSEYHESSTGYNGAKSSSRKFRS